MSCPWCEVALELPVEQEEHQCPECLTTWRYEVEREAEFALAA